MIEKFAKISSIITGFLSIIIAFWVFIASIGQFSTNLKISESQLRLSETQIRQTLELSAPVLAIPTSGFTAYIERNYYNITL